MNKAEYLLVCLMEECAELSAIASKTLLFGTYSTPIDGKTILTNVERLVEEYVHINAVMRELQKTGVVPDEIYIGDIVVEKRSKLNMFMDISRLKGTLEE